MRGNPRDFSLTVEHLHPTVMKLYALLILLSGGAHVLAQFDDANVSPLPQRLLVTGAVPLPPGGRPPFRRQRLQAPADRPGPLPPPNAAVVRNRRPGPGRPLQPLPVDTSFPNTVTPSGQTPPPIVFTQAFPSSLEPAANTAAPPPPPPPPAVEEAPEEEDYDEDDVLSQPQPAPEAPVPRPSAFGPRPQNLQPAVFRPTRPAFKPSPPPPLEAAPVPRQQGRPRPPAPSPTPRPLPIEEDLPAVSRGPTRTTFRPSPPPQQAPVRQLPPQPQQPYVRPTGHGKKPVSQVISRYREDNPDGSITWGFENDDGTFKEETIGVDCTVHGKYGYVDPDGLRREYSYSSGIPCDKDVQKKRQEAGEGFIDYQTNKYVLPNGDSLDLEAVVKNKARRPVQAYKT